MFYNVLLFIYDFFFLRQMQLVTHHLLLYHTYENGFSYSVIIQHSKIICRSYKLSYSDAIYGDVVPHDIDFLLV